MLLHLLGTEPRALEIRGRTLPAGLRHHHRVVAVMATGTPSVSRAMHGQRDGAIGALEGAAPLPAKPRRRIATSIQEHEDLFATSESIGDGGRKVAADDDVRPLLRILGAHQIR